MVSLRLEEIQHAVVYLANSVGMNIPELYVSALPETMLIEYKGSREPPPFISASAQANADIATYMQMDTLHRLEHGRSLYVKHCATSTSFINFARSEFTNSLFEYSTPDEVRLNR
jgi:hypothetical protein